MGDMSETLLALLIVVVVVLVMTVVIVLVGNAMGFLSLALFLELLGELITAIRN